MVLHWDERATFNAEMSCHVIFDLGNLTYCTSLVERGGNAHTQWLCLLCVYVKHRTNRATHLQLFKSDID